MREDDQGHSAYHAAAVCGSTSSLQTLLEADPHHVDDVDESKFTPLMLVVMEDDVKLVKLLLL